VRLFFQTLRRRYAGSSFSGDYLERPLPGGGTTDYAVEIFYAAIKEKKYTCFLKQGTSLDMMYMPDAIKAGDQRHGGRSGEAQTPQFFNVTAMHFTPRYSRRRFGSI